MRGAGFLFARVSGEEVDRLALGSEPVALIAGASRDRRRDRFLLLAILLSLAVHVLIALLWLVFAPRLVKLRLLPAPQPTEQFVTISSAVRIEHRAVPQPQRRAPPPAPAPRPMPKQEQAATPAQAPQRFRRELSTTKLAARPAPPQSTPFPRPSPQPVPRRSTPAPRTVAQATQREAEASKNTALTSEKLAQLDQEFEKTIAQARAAANPLNVTSREAPAATKRYRTEMVGIDGRLTGFQGLCDPIKTWEAEGWDYYYVACNVAFDDGRVDRQGVPWPVRFPPQADPFAGTGRQNVPLAGPLPGWRPGPNDQITPELRRYFHDRGVEL
jgi:cytoskeletal protein RodZ